MTVRYDRDDERPREPRPPDEGRSLIDFLGRISRLTSVTSSIVAVTIGLLALAAIIVSAILF